MAVRALTAWVLQRERAIQAGSAPPSATEVLRKQLAEIHPQMLLQGIQRHRLESCLQADPALRALIPTLWVDLQHVSRLEAMAALALSSLTSEMALLFADAGIPLLVFKGIPLALQTTGSLIARGRGDCDLLVDPSQLGEAIALLQSAGLTLCRSKCAAAMGSDSRASRYCLLVSHEISFYRFYGGRLQWIDLHWHVSAARGVLPGFKKLWQNRDAVMIGKANVWTLSRSDAMLHSCCNSAVDSWKSLRSLVDIERLGRGLDASQMSSLLTYRLVRKGLTIVADAGFWASPQFEFSSNFVAHMRAEQVTKVATYSQLTCPKIDESLLEFGLRNLNLSYSPINFLVKLLLALIPPDALVNPHTGALLSARGVLIRRFQKLQHQIKVRRAVEPTIPDFSVPLVLPDRPD